jgi:D-alanyl-D-alanine carboxypeptidase/D-alanyl-D-alanine-endopeptidase (penicillin-binding protein 4)
MELRLRWIAALLLLANCASVPAPDPYRAIIDAQPRAIWSVLIEEDDGRVVFAHNADKLSIPASNRKLFASATIANCLGLDTTLTTEVWRDGDDLVLRGDGDPSLGSWRWERQEDFDDLARQLRTSGITRVRDVIADVSLFDRITIPGSWKFGNIGSDYAAPVDALAWGENEIPVDRAVPDAAMHAANALRDALFLRGIEITGTTRVNTEPHKWTTRVTTLRSPFVGELLRTVLKNSHNLYAEMLLKRAGGGTYENAFALERTLLTGDLHIANDSFQFVDGSGLAPDDLVTPQAVIRVLRWMNDPVRRDYWWSVLAQPANEGTLRRRLVTLEPRVRAKTGTINGVNALSGIIDMGNGRYRYFSIILNHHLASGDEALRLIDELVLVASRTSSRTN